MLLQQRYGSQTFSPYVVRMYRRFPAQCSFYYLGSHFLGSGTVREISKQGWRVEGNYCVHTEMTLSLSVLLPGLVVPLNIQKVIVRWTRGHEFGLQVLEMQAPEWDRLVRFVESIIPRSSSQN